LQLALEEAAEQDTDFGEEIERLGVRLRDLDAQAGGGAGASSVRNTISGGTVSGPVVQGRDFRRLTITTSPTVPSGTDAEPGKD
jgi:hypothetical protein